MLIQWLYGQEVSHVYTTPGVHLYLVFHLQSTIKKWKSVIIVIPGVTVTKVISAHIQNLITGK